MKTIKVPCPKCGINNHYTSAALTASKGQAQCTGCNHIFTLVRKSKPTPAPQDQHTAAPKSNETPKHTDDLLSANGWKASGSPSNAKATPQAEVLPKASTGQSRPFADKDNDKNFQAEAAVEALLQRNTANAPTPANLPMPTIDTLLKNVQHPSAGGPTQNIHIQAQSLVFNLVSGKEAPPTLLQQPPLLLTDDASDTPTSDSDTTAVRKNHETNWTLACLVALTILIIQIFYYFLTRM